MKSMIKKQFNNTLIIFFLSFLFFNNTLFSQENQDDIKNEQPTSADNSLVLIQDQLKNLDNFRKISDPFPEVKDKKEEPTRKGLENLKFSGSAQFSEWGLDELVKKIDQKDIIIVDLRRESHGFINGLPVSWMNMTTGWSNQGLSVDEISIEEKNLLRDALKTGNIIITKILKSDGEKELVPMPITATRISTESNLCAKNGLGYVRIPVLDHKRPTDAEVDMFLAFYRTRPAYSWVHFHCKGGSGRTSTFLVMVDMMNNAKNISYNDIMSRQSLINGKNLEMPSTFLANHFNEEFEERKQFLEKFYDYCKENKDDFKTTWTEYLNPKVIEE